MLELYRAESGTWRYSAKVSQKGRRLFPMKLRFGPTGCHFTVILEPNENVKVVANDKRIRLPTQAFVLAFRTSRALSLSLFQTCTHPCPLSPTLKRPFFSSRSWSRFDSCSLGRCERCSTTGLRRPHRPHSPRGGQLGPSSDGSFAGQPGRHVPLGEK